MLSVIELMVYNVIMHSVTVCVLALAAHRSLPGSSRPDDEHRVALSVHGRPPQQLQQVPETYGVCDYSSHNAPLPEEDGASPCNVRYCCRLGLF